MIPIIHPDHVERYDALAITSDRLRAPVFGGANRQASVLEGLKAVAGATLTCTGKKSGGGTVEIPVTVVKASDRSVTWKFDR